MSTTQRLMRPGSGFTPKSISGLALWLDASQSGDLYTTDAGPVVPVSAPTEIAGLSDWYDATDVATVTLSGTKVTSWASRVSGGRTLTQGTDSLRPVMTDSVQNGLRMAKFDGVDDYIRTATPETFADKTVFVVSLPTDVTSNQTAWAASKQNITVYGYYYSMGFRQGGAATVVRPETVGASARRTNTSANEAVITSLQFKTADVVAGSFSSVGPYRNGTLFDTNDAAVLSDYAIGSTMGANDSVPASGFFSNFFSGYVGEVLVYDSYLSSVDRARVEKYLANKWGISQVHANATAASDPVGYWRDRSGNSRHATQSTAANRPAISASAQNGKKTVTFTGSPKTLTRAAYTAENGLSGLTRIAVCTMSSGSAAMLSRVYNGGGDVLLQTVSSQLRFFAGSSFYVASDAPNYAAIVGTAPHIVGSVYDGTAASAAGGLRPYLDGTALPQNTISGTLPTTLPTGTPDFWLGSNIGVNNYWPGVVLEYITYSRALTNAERSRLERYLAAKWGIALAPQVSNADAQDWINRVYQNGASVTASTAAAVNQFCNDIDSAGIRDRFFRLSLMAGTGINACLVPLYRGPAYGGTVYGNTTDTNVGPFVSNDYAETGASGGLTGNGTSKYLNLGIAPSNLPTYTSAHMAVYHSQPSGTNQTRAWISCQDTAVASAAYLSNGIFGTPAVFGLYLSNATANYNTGASQTGAAGGMRVLSRTSATRIDNYYNAVSQANSTTDITGGIAGVVSTQPFFVFANNNKATADQFMNGRIMAYSVGIGLTQSQVDAYYTAMQAFQTALTRNV